MLRRFILLLCLFGPANAALAESVFVNDALYLGLHQDNTLSSTIIELIPSGTELELLAREDNLLQVRTQTGITGWVDGGYITDQLPGRARTTILETRLRASTDRVAELEEKLSQAEQSAEDTADQLSQALKSRPAASGETPIPSTTLREMQALAEENQRLKQQASELEAMQLMAVERAQAAESERKLALENRTIPAADNPQDSVNFDDLLIFGLAFRQPLLFGCTLLLAFAVGGWLVDLSVRRRHGGHRL